ncbi:hypothetical protein OC846_006944, partial [Tilletia horrida]
MGIDIRSNMKRHVALCKTERDDPRPAIAPETRNTPPMMTIEWLSGHLKANEPHGYVGPESNQVGTWLDRLSAPEIMEGQDLQKMFTLIGLPRYSNEGKETEVRYPLPVGQDVFDSIGAGLEQLHKDMKKLPVPWRQLLNSEQPELSWTRRPSNLKPQTEVHYSRVGRQMVLFLVRLYVKCYGPSPDCDALDVSRQDVEDGLETAMNAMFNADSTLKAHVHNILAGGGYEWAVYSILSLMVTSSVPEDLSQSLLVLFVTTLAIKDPVNRTFATAKAFTPELSRIIYLGKAAWAVGEMDRIREECSLDSIIHMLIQSGKTVDDYKAQRFAEEYRRALGSDALFNIGLRWLLSLRLLGQKIAADADGNARLAWARDGQ